MSTLRRRLVISALLLAAGMASVSGLVRGWTLVFWLTALVLIVLAGALAGIDYVRSRDDPDESERVDEN